MKKLIALLLVALLVFGMTACGTSAYDSLAGTWTNEDPVDEDDIPEILNDLGFFESEIEIAKDMDGFCFVDYIELGADKSYEMGTDKKATKKSIKAWIEALYEEFYDNRDKLADYEGYFNDCASVEEFKEAYVYACFDNYDSFDELMTAYVDHVWDIYSLETETGTYTAGSTKIGFKIDGEKDYEYVEYTLKNDTLKVTYSDSKVTYERK